MYINSKLDRALTKQRKQTEKNNNKKIIIFVGKGKSTLIDFFIDEKDSTCIAPKELNKWGSAMLNKPFNIVSEEGYKISEDNEKRLKNIVDGKVIKCEIKYNTPIKQVIPTKFVIQVNDEEALKKIPLSIKRRALIYRLDIIKLYAKK